jgi:hypothetical protein
VLASSRACKRLDVAYRDIGTPITFAWFKACWLTLHPASSKCTFTLSAMADSMAWSFPPFVASLNSIKVRNLRFMLEPVCVGCHTHQMDADGVFVGVCDLASFSGVNDPNKQIIKGRLFFRNLPKSWTSCDFRFTSQYSPVRNLILMDNVSFAVTVLKQEMFYAVESLYHGTQVPAPHRPKGVYPAASMDNICVNGLNYSYYNSAVRMYGPEIPRPVVPGQQSCIVSTPLRAAWYCLLI